MPLHRDLQNSPGARPFPTGRVILETSLAAACGWALSLVVYLLWFGIGQWRAYRGYPYSWQILRDQLTITVLWVTATGSITVLTTLVLIVPYVLLRSPVFLVQHPSRLYLEPCLLVTFAMGGFAFLLRPTADSGWQTVLLAGSLSFIAAVISLAGSFVLLRRLRRLGS